MRNSYPPAFHIMTKPSGARCNLDCQYCFYLDKEALYPGSNFVMSDEVLENFTRQYIEAQQVPEVTFAWQGGEPTLLGLDFYEKAVAYQKKFARPGMQVLNTFQTNGVLLDETWCQFFKRENFLVGLSLDGPREYHDAYRIDKGGQPTFDKVIRGLDLLKRHDVDFNILACVNNLTGANPTEIYRFFRNELKIKFLQFIPIVERGNELKNHEDKGVTQQSVTGAQYGKFLISIFDEWVQRDVGRVFIQLFDTALGAWLGQPGALCIFAETCGLALAMEHNGDVYACDHYVDPRYKLGNLMDTELIYLVGLIKQRKFGSDKNHTLPNYCRQCNFLFACNGGCPKNRIQKSPQSEPGLNYLCAGYKAFFEHIDEPMKLMAALIKTGRAPAEIMHLL